MNILFVSSGNSINGISSLTKNQGDSLKNLGHFVTFFTIKGKGLVGYSKNILKLRKYLKNQKFDVVHAHYSLSGIVASFAGSKPLIVSLMGSDVNASIWSTYLVRLFGLFFWDSVIVKSLDMKTRAGLSKAQIIPNGVDFNTFKVVPKAEALKVTNWNPSKKHILFAANPARPEKNFQLASKAFNLLKTADVELQKIGAISYQDMVYYYNAADVILLTSLWEGSPNVIKEAMACCKKIVAVNVGDVKEVISNTSGCFVTSFDANEIAEKIDLALHLPQHNKGREQIINLRADYIADQLLEVYQKNC